MHVYLTGTVETLVSGASVSGTLTWVRSTSPAGLAFCTSTKKLYISYPGLSPFAILRYWFCLHKLRGSSCCREQQYSVKRNCVVNCFPPGRNAIVEHDVALRSSTLMSSISAQLSKPLGLGVDTDCSNLYIADSGNHRVLKYNLGGSQPPETIIGTGTAGPFLSTCPPF